MKESPGRLFLALYAVFSVYFAGVMIRLLLILCPALCILAGIGLSETLHNFTRHIKNISEWWTYTEQED